MLRPILAILLLWVSLLGADAAAKPRTPREGELLMEFIASDFLELEELVIESLLLTREVNRPAGGALFARKASSYRCTTRTRGGRSMETHLIVAVRLENGGTLPWMVAGATLSADGEELPRVHVWQAEPLAQREYGMILVKVEVPEEQARSTFTLTLRDESGRRLFTLENVRFP